MDQFCCQLRTVSCESGVGVQSKCVDCLVDVARGMEYIQSRNIIHGDLNPSNILLRNQAGVASTNPPSSGARTPP